VAALNAVWSERDPRHWLRARARALTPQQSLARGVRDQLIGNATVMPRLHHQRGSPSAPRARL
jgi:hypothetical protein